MAVVSIVERVFAGLVAAGVRAVWDGPDVRLSVAEGASRTYRLVFRDRMTAPLAAAIDAADAGSLLVTPFVPESAAAVLRERGVDYADAAGNLLLRWDGVLIDVRGRRRTKQGGLPPAPAARRPFTRSGAQVTFSLLSWPQLETATVRDIARVSGTAVGTVQAVLSDLVVGGYLLPSREERRLVRAGELLSRWAEAYALSLYTSLDLGAYRSERPHWWAQARDELVREGVDLGGEAAAALMDSRLRPTTALLYADAIPARVLAAHRCRRVDRPDDANVLVRRRFWVDPGTTGRERPTGLAPSPLIYADLLVSGDPRQREHAQHVRRGDARLLELDGT